MEKKQKTGIEIEGVLNGMKSTDTLTKKQLEEITGYSDNTISKIMKVQRNEDRHGEETKNRD